MVIQTSFQSSQHHFVPNFFSNVVNLILLVVYVMYWCPITNMESPHPALCQRERPFLTSGARTGYEPGASCESKGAAVIFLFISNNYVINNNTSFHDFFYKTMGVVERCFKTGLCARPQMSTQQLHISNLYFSVGFCKWKKCLLNNFMSVNH